MLKSKRFFQYRKCLSKTFPSVSFVLIQINIFEIDAMSSLKAQFCALCHFKLEVKPMRHLGGWISVLLWLEKRPQRQRDWHSQSHVLLCVCVAPPPQA